MLRNQQLAKLFSSFIIHFDSEKMPSSVIPSPWKGQTKWIGMKRIGHSMHAEVRRPSTSVAQPRLVTKCLLLIPNQLNQQEKSNETTNRATIIRLQS